MMRTSGPRRPERPRSYILCDRSLGAPPLEGTLVAAPASSSPPAVLPLAAKIFCSLF